MLDAENITLDISQSVIIAASVEYVYDTLIRRLTVDNITPDGKPLVMVLET